MPTRIFVGSFSFLHQDTKNHRSRFVTHIQHRSTHYLFKETRCRCLGWEEEEEEEEAVEEEEDCLEGMWSSGIGAEVQELLNLFMEDRCRRVRVTKIREIPKPTTVSYSPGLCSGTGRIWNERTYFAGKTVSGKGPKHFSSESKWDRLVRYAKKEMAEKSSYSSPKQGSSRVDQSLSGKSEGLSCNKEENFPKGTDKSSPNASLHDWRSNMILSYAGESRKQEQTAQNGARKLGSDTSCNDLRSDGRWASTLESQKWEETIQKGTEKPNSELSLNGLSSVSTVGSKRHEETVRKALEKTCSETSLNDVKGNVRWASTVESQKQEEAIQRGAKKSGVEVSSNNLRSSMGWVSTVASQKQEETSSLEKGERSCAGLRSVEESIEQLENTVPKNSRKLVPAVPYDDLSKSYRRASVTEYEEQEMVEKTTETLIFERHDEFIRNSRTSSSAVLEQEKGMTEENMKITSEGPPSVARGSGTPKKMFKVPSFKSGSNEIFSSATEVEKTKSLGGYETGNGISQKVFKASSDKLVCSKVSGSTTELEKNQSTADFEMAKKTSQKLFKAPSYKSVSNEALCPATEVKESRPTPDYEMGNKTASKLFENPSHKLVSNEVVGIATELEKKKSTTDIETGITYGKSALERLSDESESSLGMVSAEGVENHDGSTEKFSEGSTFEVPISQLSSGDFASVGPSEEVWAVAGWSSREEFEELQSSGKETEEKATETSACQEALGQVSKTIERHFSAELEEERKSSILNSTGKVIVKRPSRWLWSSIVEICRKGWGSHAESESSPLKSGSGRPSTESPGSEDWFSVPELEDQESTQKEKSRNAREKSTAQRQANNLNSNAGLNPITDLKETEGTKQEKTQKPARKWASEGSLDELLLRRRRISSAGIEEHECVETGKGNGLDLIADSKKTEITQQERSQKSARKYPSEGSSDELVLPRRCILSGANEEHDRLEKGKGKAASVNIAELEEHEDTYRLIGSSETEEKKSEAMSKMSKRNKQVPKETFTLWEEALLLENKQRLEDEKFMREALSEARMAADAWEVPVGAVLVQHGKIIARAHNLVEENRDATAHAEMLCIRDASNQMRTWRLADSTLYVTLEPCAMCAGAILQARVGTVVWGAPNKLLGADGSWISLFPRSDKERFHDTNEGPLTTGPIHPFHPNIAVRRGVLASDCSDVMQHFFKLRRKKDKKTGSTSSFPLKSYPTKLFNKVHEIFSIFCL
eukprot:Gb_32214 [translate_table: standard]